MAIIMGYSDTGAETKVSGKQPFLTIGLIPERNIFKQVERYEPLADYLSKKIGVNIKLMVLTRYGNIIDNFVSAHMDAAFFGSFTYALAHSKLGVEAIARPEDVNGISTYYGLIFARKDSGIKNIKDMKKKNFAFVDKATTAGYLLPLAYFAEHGIEAYKTFFNETYFTGTHQDAIYDVLNKKADVGAAKNTMFYRLAANDRRIIEANITFFDQVITNFDDGTISPFVSESILPEVGRDWDSVLDTECHDDRCGNAKGGNEKVMTFSASTTFFTSIA